MQDEEYIWIVGDIHGQFDALSELYSHIYENFNITKLIFIGDYIDRGFKSKQVIDFLLNLKQKCVFLIGNHEQLLLDLYRNEFDSKKGKVSFFNIGGKKTLDSFGYNHLDDFLQNIDKKYIRFLTKLRYSHMEYTPEPFGHKIVFIHAGIIPEINFEEQISVNSFDSYHKFIKKHKLAYDYTFLWIRKEFFSLNSKKWHDNLIIHGHTPVHLLNELFDKPPHLNFRKSNSFLKPGFLKFAKFNDSLPFFRLIKNSHATKAISINLDTGAAYGKKLTALGLDFKNVSKHKIPAKIIQSDINTHKITAYSTSISL